MTLNLAAYSAEILRAGISATAKGQLETGRALGMTTLQSYCHVVLVPAFARVYPALISQSIIVMLGSALDPELVGEVLRVLEALAKEGMTLILVTHEMSFARDVADRVVFMHQGRIHEEGAPSELFSNPQTPELKQFISAVL